MELDHEFEVESKKCQKGDERRTSALENRERNFQYSEKSRLPEFGDGLSPLDDLGIFS